MTDLIPIIAAIGAASVPLLSLLFYGLGQARWQGRVQEQIDNLKQRADDASQKRKAMEDKQDEKWETINLQLASINSNLSDLTGQLKAKGHVT